MDNTDSKKLVKPVESPGEKAVDDIYRDTVLRYFGYAGHLGWVCRSFLPSNMFSMASVAYVCADAFDKTTTSAQQGDPEKKVLLTATDAFLWHFFASFAVPGIIINGVSSITSSLRTQRSKCRPRSRYFLLPCLLSGLTIPIISKPIDNTVEEFMNSYVRKTLNKSLFSIEEVQLKPEADRKISKFKWFYEQSRDLSIAEIERYHQKLREQGSKTNTTPNYKPPQSPIQSPNSNEILPSPIDSKLFFGENMDSDDTMDGPNNKRIQADKTTSPQKPPRPPRPPKPED